MRCEGVGQRLLTGCGVVRQACRGHEEAALSRVPMLFNTNSFGVGPGNHSFGLLYLAARFNHACGHTCLARLKRADRLLPPQQLCHLSSYATPDPSDLQIQRVSALKVQRVSALKTLSWKQSMQSCALTEQALSGCSLMRDSSHFTQVAC